MVRTGKKKENTDWKAVEKIVYALEKFITSNSKVEYNVKLPVTGKSKARKRQVDVLITVTNGRKRTRFIVEVQKRNRKVDLNIFHGWVKKMKSVDCQHLICVSTTGFPSSIIEDVQKEYGSETVTLMTLNDFDSLVDPTTQVNIDLDVESFKWAIQNKRWDIIDFGKPALEEASKKFGSTVSVEFNATKEIFLYQGKKYSLSGLCELIVRIKTDEPEMRAILQNGDPYNFKVNFKEKDNLYAIIEKEQFKITKWEFILQVKVTPIKFNAESRKFAYRHEIDNNTLAWVCSTTFTYDQKIQTNEDNSTMETKSIQIDFVCKLVDGKMQWRIHEHGIQKMAN